MREEVALSVALRYRFFLASDTHQILTAAGSRYHLYNLFATYRS